MYSATIGKSTLVNQKIIFSFAAYSLATTTTILLTSWLYKAADFQCLYHLCINCGFGGYFNFIIDISAKTFFLNFVIILVVTNYIMIIFIILIYDMKHVSSLSIFHPS